MNFNGEIIQELMRDFVNLAQPKKVYSADDELYTLACYHRVDGIIGYLCSKHRIFDDNALCEKFISSYISAIAVAANQCELFSKLTAYFCEQNIELVVFKGYVLRELYPVNLLRSFSDIDLLIHKEGREKSDRLMKRLGYRQKVDYGSVFSYKKGLEYYELHDTLAQHSTNNSQSANGSLFSCAWEHAHKTDSGLFELDDEYHLVYLINHIAKHIYYGGAGIRMYMDIALYILQKSKSLDFEKVMRFAESEHLDVFLKTTIFAACKWFDVELPTVFGDFRCDEQTLDSLLEFTMNKGVFGNAMKSSGEAVVQIQSKSSKHPKAKAILNIAFLPYSQMKLKYAYLEKAPVLLPVAWVTRAITSITKIGKKKQKVRDILGADMKDINNHNILLEKIGL